VDRNINLNSNLLDKVETELSVEQMYILKLDDGKIFRELASKIISSRSVFFPLMESALSTIDAKVLKKYFIFTKTKINRASIHYRYGCKLKVE